VSVLLKKNNKKKRRKKKRYVESRKRQFSIALLITVYEKTVGRQIEMRKRRMQIETKDMMMF